VELPTYTSIWRIEKRLYKLYDFRLPMPLPVGQIAVFTAITVPYIILLTVLGLPFNHTLFWLYVLPPGVLTWLATRPVLESKRLPELIVSQARYLGEPSSWCRMAPLAEKDEMVVVGRVWRRAGQVRPATVSAASPAVVSPATARRPARSVRPAAALPAQRDACPHLPASAPPRASVRRPAAHLVSGSGFPRLPRPLPLPLPRPAWRLKILATVCPLPARICRHQGAGSPPGSAGRAHSCSRRQRSGRRKRSGRPLPRSRQGWYRRWWSCPCSGHRPDRPRHPRRAWPGRSSVR
jgi:hypothetical protein